MSYYSQNANQRATYDVPASKYDNLPKVNDKRFSDVIDYSQQRPQSGYGHYDAPSEEQGNYDNRNYVQRQSGPTRDSQPQYGGANHDGIPNGAHSHGASQGGAGPQLNFDVQDGYPVQLVQADPRTGKFKLNDEVAAELVGYEGNISFVTIAGKYRTGKSFILNKLLNLSHEGFHVDPTTDACTQGIWMWNKPVYNERDNTFIFFLDTEGSNSVEKSATHDAKIFALAMLMSSYFIYNSVGAIDENSINDLTLTTQLSKNIAVSADESSEHTLSYYTPKFLWALRDFTLELQDSRGQHISANQYLENALTDQSTYGKSSDTNKKVRQALLNYFKDRECMTFVRPANDERELRKLNSVPTNQIRPDFMKQVNALRDKILTKATAKQLKGVNLNMRMYIAMVNQYIDAINQGSVPNISSAWDHLVENECREAFEQSVELYEVALKQFFFSEDKAKSMEDLYHILKNIRDSTLEKYNKFTAAIERNDVAQDYKNELKDFIDKKEQAVVTINEELNNANNEELLKNLAQILKNNMTSGVYSASNIQDFHNDFDDLLTNYDREGQGLAKTTSLIEFLRHFQPEMISTLMLSLNKNLSNNQKSFDSDKARYVENERNLKMNIETLKEKERNAAEENARLKAEKAELAHKATKLNDQIVKVKEEELKKFETEKERTQRELNRLKDVEKAKLELEKQNQEMLARINKNKKGCCNIF